MRNLTILIPTKNRPDFLDCAIKSVRNSFGDEIKIIIGDNGNYEVTHDLLLKNKNYCIQVRHLKNPPDSTYVFNLQTLIDFTETEWLVIMHDDDFFVGNCSSTIFPILTKNSNDFIFTDHWIASHLGQLLQEETALNSKFYERSSILPGDIKNLAIYAIKQRICLDGFYIKTSLAKSVRLDLSKKVFSDFQWLIKVCVQATNGCYLEQRTFAYRLNVHGLTASGLDQNEMLQCLVQLKQTLMNEEANTALKRRIYDQSKNAFKYSLKRGKFANLLYAFYSMMRYQLLGLLIIEYTK